MPYTTSSMVTGKLVIYELGHLPPNERSRFYRRFYGWTDRAKGGKYTYSRAGYLDDVPFVRPEKSVLIIRNEDVGRVLAFLHEYNAQSNIRDVSLTEADLQELGM